VSAVARPVTCDGLRATIVGTRGADTIVGTQGRDVIAARSGWDTVWGRGGNDVICGADGSDSLLGGPGDDRVFGGRAAVVNDREGPQLRNDTIRGGPGDDQIVGGRDNRDLPAPLPDMVDYASAVRGMDVDLDTGIAVGQGRDRLSIQSWYINGSDHDDHLIGSPFRDNLYGGLGADYLAGRGGPDTIIGDVSSNSGDASPDVVLGQDGNDFLSTWGGEDVQYGGPGDDELSDWGTSSDRLYGQDDDDKVTDVVVPAAGQVLRGGPGRNEVILWTRTAQVSGVMDLRIGETTVDLAQPTVVETSEFTTVRVPNGAWTIYGTVASEYFWENPVGPHTIYAGAGDDYLGGTDSDDQLEGGAGHDQALPEGGQDTCVSIEEVLFGVCETAQE
jgi:Ca2+-binding RTX toxin-like protein